MTVFAVGIVDEWIQFYLPQRVGVVPDIYLNGVSIGLVLLLSAKVIYPQDTSSPVSPGNFKIAVIATVSVLILRAGFIPTISEWGYRHKDPRIGIFYSRFSREELLSAEPGELKRNDPYLEKIYLGQWKALPENPGVDPYLKELSMHLIHRAHYYERKNLWRAYKENLILVHYFPAFGKRVAKPGCSLYGTAFITKLHRNQGGPG